MGLFDNLFETQTASETHLNPAEAFAAITLVAIASDGFLSEQEGQSMSFTLSRMKLFRSYSDDVMGRMLDNLLGRLRRNGPSELMGQAKASLPFELRTTAFAIATDLVLTDGTVTEAEQAFLNELYQVLDISDEMALSIVEVMKIKNQG